MTTPRQHVERLKNIAAWLRRKGNNESESVQWALDLLQQSAGFVHFYLNRQPDSDKTTALEQSIIDAAKAIEETR